MPDESRKTAMPPTDVPDVAVERIETFRANCSCGWISENERAHEGAAHDEATDHLIKRHGVKND